MYLNTIETYDWGQVKIRAISHIINREDNTGYVSVSTYFFTNSSDQKNCQFKLLNFQAVSDSKVFIGDVNDVWIVPAYSYLDKQVGKIPVLVSRGSSRTAQISDIDIFAKIKTNEYCEIANTTVNIKEKLVLEMRHHTLWGFLFDALMSV